MRVIKADIWDYWTEGGWVVIPTNGFVKKNGEAVMGRGLALQARNKFPKLAHKLGEKLKFNCGNVIQFFPERILAFKVKYNWWEEANLSLIEESASALFRIQNSCGAMYFYDDLIYLPKVGCGNGKLNWKDVEPILDKYLDERFIVVDWK